MLQNPAESKRLHPEKHYQNRFCYGQTEFVLPDKTRIYCLTDLYAVEVDFAQKWAECIGQAIYYAEMTGRQPACLLIIETDKDLKHLEKIRKLKDKYNLTVWTISP